MFEPCYIRLPDVSERYFIFISDDDLWKVNVQADKIEAFKGPMDAVRLTNNASMVRNAKISPDGKQIAFISDESGQSDCYVVSEYGGQVKRLTYYGDTHLIGWKNSKTVRISSSVDDFQNSSLKEIDVSTLSVKSLNYGPTSYYASSKTTTVLARSLYDIALWKGYQGGSAGQIWVKSKQDKEFRRVLTGIKADIAQVELKESELYYLTDKDGVGNIYSYDLTTKKSKVVTELQDFYVRGFSVWENSLLFSSAGRLFFHNRDKKKSTEKSIRLISSFEQSRERFVSAPRNLQAYTTNEDGSLIVTVVRGNMVYMKPWIGASKTVEHAPGTRFRDVISLGNEDTFVGVATAEDGSDVLKKIKLNDESGKAPGMTILAKDLGKISDLKASKCGKFVLIATHRHELWLKDIAKKSITKVDKSDANIEGFDFSIDSAWACYSKLIDGLQEIWVYSLKDKKTRRLLKSVNSDTSPVFDETGQYLFFIGAREYTPRYHESHFDIGFPDVVKPYVVSLTKTAESLFDQPLLYSDDIGDDKDDDRDGDKHTGINTRISSYSANLKKSNKRAHHSGLSERSLGFETLSSAKKPSQKGGGGVQQKKSAAHKNKSKKTKKIEVKIDFDRIENRVQPFPVKAGGWEEIFVNHERVFFTRSYESNHRVASDDPGAESLLVSYEFKSGSLEVVLDDFEGGELTPDGKWILALSEKDLRLFPSDSKPSHGSEYARKDGWIELERVKTMISPKQEWAQIYREAWHLQKENFYNPSKSKVNFEAIYRKYLPVLERVHTRSELSDLIQDMQGDLQTSHCYEFSGDYHRKKRDEHVAVLGATMTFQPKTKSYKIERIQRGDAWSARECSPLEANGVNLKDGDEIYGLDGAKFFDAMSIYRLLENKAGEYVELRVLRKGKRKLENVTVFTLDRKSKLTYRDWVTRNREIVHAKSKGKTGYIHIPSMGMDGISEFYRNFFEEQSKESLIIDVRYNSGGFVSQLILKALTQKKLANTKAKWAKNWGKYPGLVGTDKMVCLINGSAGSDGDIFSYAFRKLKLGPLIGTKTWGGVIGIFPKVKLIDGTVTTQPEYSIEFQDEATPIENMGVKPDVEVENTPDDWSKSQDRQLEEGLRVLQGL